MTVKFLGYTCRKKIFYPVISLIGLVIIASFLINRYWSPILADKVKSTILTSTDSLYTVTFKDARLHILQGKLVIYDITIKPNLPVYNKRKQQHLAPNNLYELHVKKLVLRRIHPLRLYFKNQLLIDQIVVSAPDLRVSYQLNHTKDTIPADKRTTWQRIRPMLKSLQVKEIDLNDIKFRYNDYSGIKLNISELREMNITAKDLLIDSTTQQDKSRFYYCRDLITELNNYHGMSKNNLYRYEVKSMVFSTLTSRLQAYDMALLPAQPEVYYRQAMHNRYAVHLDTLQADRFDYQNYLKYHTLKCSKLTLAGGRVNFTGNTAIDSASKTNKLASFPNVAVHRLHSRFQIDSVAMRRIDVRYDAYSKRSKKAGFISFSNTYGLMRNVSSEPTILKKNNICDMQFTTWLMGKGRADVQFKFNLTDSAKSYSAHGRVDAMKLSALNPATKPLALLELKSGQLNSLTFDIAGNRKRTDGRVKMLYNNLKVNILRPDTINDKFRHFAIGSIFANYVILERDNPSATGEMPRTYPVSYLRPDNAGFFKTLFKTLLPGVKASVGYGAAVEQKVKAEIIERRQQKAEHQLKKQLRQQRKALKKRMQANVKPTHSFLNAIARYDARLSAKR
jgi:hypothetical protein